MATTPVPSEPRFVPTPVLGARHEAVKRLRALARDPRARAEASCCVLEGPRVIGAALARGASVVDVYFGDGARPAFGPLVADLTRAGARLHDLKEGVLEKVGTTRTPQPVIAVVHWAPRAGIDALADLRDGLRDGCTLVAVDVTDPGNLGTIVRSAEAAGAAAVVVAGDAVDVSNPKAVRASAGGLFGVPIVVVHDAAAAIDALRGASIRCFGAVARGGTSPAALPLARGAAVAVGSEARGLDAGIVGRLDGTVTIPMVGAAESLNVAMAATILCFEAARQRADTAAVDTAEAGTTGTSAGTSAGAGAGASVGASWPGDPA